MDAPNPTKFPILNYVMSQFSPRTTTSLKSSWDDVDIEQPKPVPKPEPVYNITDHMPHLNDPMVRASMASAISEVSEARSVLEALGDRPDHESVDRAKQRVCEIEAGGLENMEEVSLDGGRVVKSEVEKELEVCRAVMRLDYMHEAYEKLLKNAEDRLVAIYDTMAPVGGGKGKEVVEDVSDKVYEEVVKVMKDAAENGVMKVELSGRLLRTLPEAFGRIKGLVVFDVSHNQLEVIPDSLAGLENLEELNLSSNLLESLPDSLGFLHKLKILNVSTNKLHALPDGICHCRSLVELDASYNRLSYLPTNIGFELKKLKKLFVYYNKIRNLPTSICEMRSLVHLDAHFNELRGLPHAIGKLSTLQILNISSNFSDMVELPETFGDLDNLKELNLANNQIYALPNTFGRLEKLEQLNLDGNPFVIPPVEVVKCGVDAVKEYMSKRWLNMLIEEDEKSITLVNDEANPGWLTRSTSWLSRYVSGAVKSPRDSYLDEQL